MTRDSVQNPPTAYICEHADNITQCARLQLTHTGCREVQKNEKKGGQEGLHAEEKDKLHK